MTMEEAMLSLQLLAEERVGAPIRANAKAAKARENAAAHAAVAAVAN